MYDLFIGYFLSDNLNPVGGSHFAAAILAVLAGPVLFFSMKGTIKHKWVGYFYFFTMMFLNITALMRYNLTGSFNMFHFFALFSLGTIIPAMLSIRKAIKTGERRHYFTHSIMMSWSYFGLFAALISEAATREFSYIFAGPGYWLKFGAFLTLFLIIGGWWTSRMIAAKVPLILALRPTR